MLVGGRRNGGAFLNPFRLARKAAETSRRRNGSGAEHCVMTATASPACWRMSARPGLRPQRQLLLPPGGRFDQGMFGDCTRCDLRAVADFRHSPTCIGGVSTIAKLAGYKCNMSGWVPLPFHPDVTAVELAPRSALLAERAVRSANMDYKSSNIGSALELDWGKRTLAAILGADSAEKKAQLCKAARECLCTGECLKLQRFLSRLCNSVLKPNCKQHSENGRLLTEDDIVLGLVAQPAPPQRQLEACDMQPPDVTSEASTVKWQHLGMQYLCP